MIYKIEDLLKLADEKLKSDFSYMTAEERFFFQKGVTFVNNLKWINVAVDKPPPYYPVLLKHFPSGRYYVGCFDCVCHDWEVEGIGSLPFGAISHWMLIPEMEVQKNE